MVVLVNGAFGVGKTSVVRELRRLMPGATIFDPEPIGFVLQKMTRVEGFKDLALCRRLTVPGANCCGSLVRSVINPIGFANPDYLREIRSGLAKSGKPVLHFCLVAPIEVVRSKLAGRGDIEGDWVHRRAFECRVAHEATGFARQIPPEGRTVQEIAAELAGHLN